MSALKKFKLELKEKRGKEEKLMTGKGGKFKGGSKRELNQKLLITTNPFEKKFSKQKFEIVNKKTAKNNMLPRPGKKRQEEFGRKRDSLRMELANRRRENIMVDKRFGENDPTMSVEDKMLVRFMKEKASAHSRGTNFNLNDDDDNDFSLTHMGQSLALEDMNDDAFTASGLQPVPYDEDAGGNIDADVVKFTHFGGFEADEKDQANPMHKKSRNEIMKEIIQKSKMHKRERQMQKEQDLELVEQVDADLDEIRGLLAPMTDNAPSSHGKMVVSNDRLRMIQGLDPLPSSDNAMGASIEKKSTENDYDKIFRELARDGRAAPTDRTKTEEELAGEMAETLRKAEEKRLKRMQGIVSDDSDDETHSKKKGGASGIAMKSDRDAIADDLGDDTYHQGMGQRRAQENIMPLTYNKDGVLVNNEIFMKPKENSTSDENSSSGSEDESGSESEEEPGSENEAGYKTESESENEDARIEENSKDAQIGSMEPDFDENMSIECSDTESSSQGSEIDNDQAALEEMYDEGENSSEDEEHLPEIKKRKVSKQVMESASKELPFTFEAPQTFDDFKELIKGRSSDDQITVIKRLLILYSVKINGENSVHLGKLSGILMERIVELGNSKDMDAVLINKYREHTVELCRLYPNDFAKWCKLEIHKLRDSFNGKSSLLKAAFPGPGHIIMFKDLSRIFSCSDLHHQVMTPVMLLLGQYLSHAPISSIKDALFGISLCQIFYMYTHESKRYVPEVASFLHLMLVQCLCDCEGINSPSCLSTVRKCAPGIVSIQDFFPDYTDLSLAEIYNLTPKSPKSTLASFKMTVLHECISLLTKFCKLWSESCSIIEVFGSTMAIVKLIPSTANSKLLEQVSGASRVIGPLIESAKLKRRPLQLQKRKAMAIKTFVPKFHTSYSIDKRYDPDHQRAQEGKLKAEYKKEFKGAVRELRKDAAFLVREKLNKIKQSDLEYKKKMDKIVGQLAEQEGAMRGYEKAAKKKSNKRKF